MSDTTHSPLPWRKPQGELHEIVDGQGRFVLLAYGHAVGWDEAAANAEIVLRAVNALPGLLSAVEAIFTPEGFAAYDGKEDRLADHLTMEVKLTKGEYLALRDAVRKAREGSCK